MDNKEIVAAIMAKLRELHPELPERACVNLELDLRRMGRRQPLRQKMRVANLDQARLSRVPNLKRNATAIGNSNTPDLAERAALLRALRDVFGEADFTAQDVLEHAAERPDGDCAQALVPLLGGPVGGLRRLAPRLAKLAGKPAGGLVLTRIDDRAAALYVIQTVHWTTLGRHDSQDSR